MENHFQNSSSFLPLREDQLKKAQEIIDRVSKEIADDEYETACHCEAIIIRTPECPDNGVWFHGEETIGKEKLDVSHLEILARAIIEELEVDEPFFCSYSYNHRKPLMDRNGGGAFVIMRGRYTSWINAMCYVKDLVRNNQLPDKFGEGLEPEPESPRESD